jgi:type IV pilus assembly protein PilC
MPYYKCTFLNEDGSLEKKIIFGADKESLKRDVSESNRKLLRSRRSLFSDISSKEISFGKIKYTEFLVFNQKLIILLKAGVSFLKSLQIIIANHKNCPLKDILIKAEKDINNGIPISKAFSYPQIPFEKIYSATLLAGEKSGQLNTLLEKYNQYLEKVSSFRRELIKSLTYPTVLLVFMFIIVNVVIAFAIPKFMGLYKGMHAELPPVTKYLITFSQFMNQNLILIVGIVLGVYLVIKFIEKTNDNVVIFDYLKFKIPFIGRIILDNSIAVFSRTMAILIFGGITIPDSLKIGVTTFSNRYFFKKLQTLPQMVIEGNLLSASLQKYKFIPNIFWEIIKVGEDSGNLQEVLDKNADYFETSIDTRVNTIISFIEPMLIVFFGLLVGFMLMSIFVPIFNAVHIVR